MARFVLDTGILLHYVRRSLLSEFVDATHSPSKPPNIACASIVTVAELSSLAMRLNWGAGKVERLEDLVRKIPIVEIRHGALVSRFAEIDAYCLGRHPTMKLPTHTSSQSLGDNDIWIAATTSVLQATLLSTDKDFLFLDKVFFDVIYIDPQSNLNVSH